jgi:hypothetical protein
MSNSLRAKAERLVYAYEAMESLLPSLAGADDAMSNAVDVCRAYIAEHPEADEPIDHAWLRSIGFFRQMQPASTNSLMLYRGSDQSGPFITIEQTAVWLVSISDGTYSVMIPYKIAPQTKAGFLLLCQALGFTVQEKS